MPITYDDVLAVYPEAKAFTPEEMENTLVVANLGFPDSRFANEVQAERGRINYVMHVMTKPALDLKAPHILAQLNSPKPGIKKPSPWKGTPYGDALTNAIVT